MTSIVHLLEEGLKPRRLHYHEMETLKKKLRSKYRTAQTQLNLGRVMAQIVADSESITDKLIAEIDKYATKQNDVIPLSVLEEEYFRVFQHNASNVTPDYNEQNTYNIGDIVKHKPKNEEEILFKYNDRNTPALNLREMDICFWLCIRKVEGESPSLGKDWSENEFLVQKSQEYETKLNKIKKQKQDNGETPDIDWTWTDWGWRKKQFLDSYIKKEEGKYRKRKHGHYPGTKYWVCLHCIDTGSYDYDTDILTVNHKQIWTVRAKVLSTIISSYSLLMKQVQNYESGGPYSDKNIGGKGLRYISSIEGKALDTIQKYTKDYDEISSATIQIGMDKQLAFDTDRKNAEKWQFFYPQDFMKRFTTNTKKPKTIWKRHDIWGPDFYYDALRKKVWSDECHNKLNAIMNNQEDRRKEIFLRVKKPPYDKNVRILEPPKHWKLRLDVFEEIFKQFHGQVEGWTDFNNKYHYGFEYLVHTLSSNKKENASLDDLETWRVTEKELDFKEHLFNHAIYFNNGNPQTWTIRSIDNHIKIVIDFVMRGRAYFIQEYKNVESQRSMVQSIAESMTFGSDDNYKKMARAVIRYLKPNYHMIHETLKHMYNGQTRYSDVKVRHLRDWGLMNKNLLFKLLILEGLCLQRNWIQPDRQFHEIAKNWQIRLNGQYNGDKASGGDNGRGYGPSYILFSSYKRIWPKGEEVKDILSPKYEWIKEFLFSDKIKYNSGDFNRKFVLKSTVPQYGALRFDVNPGDSRDFPWLSHEYLRPLMNSESSHPLHQLIMRYKPRDRTMFEYIMSIHKAYMKSYKLYRQDEKFRWPKNIVGTNFSDMTVGNAIHNIKKSHIAFVKAYLPTHRIWHHPQYGCMAFGRLIPSKNPISYKKYMFHVVAYTVKVNDDDFVGGSWIRNMVSRNDIPVDRQEMECFQWQINGFERDELVDAWLSEHKGLFWRTMWKSPYTDIGPGIFPEKVIHALRRDSYYLKNKVGKELEEWEKNNKDGENFASDLEKEIEKKEELKKQLETVEIGIESLERQLKVLEKKKQRTTKDIMDKISKPVEHKQNK